MRIVGIYSGRFLKSHCTQNMAVQNLSNCSVCASNSVEQLQGIDVGSDEDGR